MFMLILFAILYLLPFAICIALYFIWSFYPNAFPKIWLKDYYHIIDILINYSFIPVLNLLFLIDILVSYFQNSKK